MNILEVLRISLQGALSSPSESAHSSERMEGFSGLSQIYFLAGFRPRPKLTPPQGPIGGGVRTKA